MTGDPFEPFETPRLTLRCIEASDAFDVSRLITPQVSSRVASWPVPYTPDMAAARIARARQDAAAGDALPLAVIVKSTNEFAGWVAVHREPKDRTRATFGYWLGEPHQGMGYMRELAPVVLATAFRLLEVDVIAAGAQTTNLASIAVMLGCGMQPVGERMVHVSSRDREELCSFYEMKRNPKR